MDETLLRKLYLEQGLSQRKLALALNTSASNVRNWVTKFGLKKNQRHVYTEEGEKTCPKCRTSQALESFYLRKDGTPCSWCKGCMLDLVVGRQNQLKMDCVQYKGGSCCVCGFHLYRGALEFHHLDPAKKDFQISKVTCGGLSAELKVELDKCALLCSNCHKMTHAGVIVLDEHGTVLQSPYVMVDRVGVEPTIQAD